MNDVPDEILGADGVLLLGSSETTRNVDPGQARRDVGKYGDHQPNVSV